MALVSSRPEAKDWHPGVVGSLLSVWRSVAAGLMLRNVMWPFKCTPHAACDLRDPSGHLAIVLTPRSQNSHPSSELTSDPSVLPSGVRVRMLALPAVPCSAGRSTLLTRPEHHVGGQEANIPPVQYQVSIRQTVHAPFAEQL